MNQPHQSFDPSAIPLKEPILHQVTMVEQLSAFVVSHSVNKETTYSLDQHGIWQYAQNMEINMEFSITLTSALDEVAFAAPAPLVFLVEVDFLVSSATGSSEGFSLAGGVCLPFSALVELLLSNCWAIG